MMWRDSEKFRCAASSHVLSSKEAVLRGLRVLSYSLLLFTVTVVSMCLYSPLSFQAQLVLFHNLIVYFCLFLVVRSLPSSHKESNFLYVYQFMISSVRFIRVSICSADASKSSSSFLIPSEKHIYDWLYVSRRLLFSVECVTLFLIAGHEDKSEN